MIWMNKRQKAIRLVWLSGYSKFEIQVKANDNTVPTINIPTITTEPDQIGGVPG